MINLLYLIAIVACVYSGFARFEWWTVLPFGLIFSLLFFLLRPQALSFGLREGGMMYLVRFFGMSALIAVPVFGFGRLLAYGDTLLSHSH